MNPNPGRPHRVLVVSYTLSAGGAERFAAVLLKGASLENVRPHLVLLRPEFTYPLPDTVPVHVLEYHRLLDLPRAVWRLRKLIHRIRPHAVLGVSTAVNVVIGLCMATLKKPPAWVAAVDTDLQRSDLRLRRMLLGLLHRQADFIVAISKGMQRQLQSAFPRLASNIVQIYYPVDFDDVLSLAEQEPAWQPPAGVPLIAAMGRAHPVKRMDLLLEAFAEVVRRLPAALVLCGDGPQLDALKARARQLNIADQVHFPGHCNNPFAIIAQADLFVLTSEAEGLGNALIEAQGMGLCAVATDCPYGPREIVAHGATGLLTAVNDPTGLARAITGLLTDDQRRMAMAAAAKKKVRRQFDFEERCRQWWALVRRAAEKRDTHGG